MIGKLAVGYDGLRATWDAADRNPAAAAGWHANEAVKKYLLFRAQVYVAERAVE